MFCLNRDDFRRRDEAQLAGFVICWERYYRGSVPVSPTDATLIDYEAELNIQGALTDQNVARLLRWKDPRMLTHPKVDGTNNHRVENVLAQLDAINQFRNGILDQQAFAQTTAGIFPNGIVWQLFLFHIARPWEWPIADQHVFRAHAVLFDQPAPQTLAGFEQYRNNFAQLAQALPDIHNGSRVDIVRRNKRLDDALMSYGQFLLAYDR
jgi:hypothetical protein